MSSTQDREAYAEQLAYASALIIGAVHDDGPDLTARRIDEALVTQPPPGVDPVHALVTVVAAQVDPTAPPSETLGWAMAGSLQRPMDSNAHRNALSWLVKFDEPGAPPLEVPDYATWTEEVIAGDRELLTLPEECAQLAVEILRRRGMSVEASAAKLDVGKNTVVRLRQRWRDRHGIKGRGLTGDTVAAS